MGELVNHGVLCAMALFSSFFQALGVIAEVVDELNVRWSKLPPPYWTNVYIHGNLNGVEKGKRIAPSLPDGHQTSENGDEVRRRGQKAQEGQTTS